MKELNFTQEQNNEEFLFEFGFDKVESEIDLFQILFRMSEEEFDFMMDHF